MEADYVPGVHKVTNGVTVSLSIDDAVKVQKALTCAHRMLRLSHGREDTLATPVLAELLAIITGALETGGIK